MNILFHFPLDFLHSMSFTNLFEVKDQFFREDLHSRLPFQINELVLIKYSSIRCSFVSSRDLIKNSISFWTRYENFCDFQSCEGSIQRVCFDSSLTDS